MPFDLNQPAAFGWLVLLGFVILFDLWAILTGHRTLSSQFHHWFRKYRWFRLLSVLLALLLAYHLFVEPMVRKP